MTLDAEERRQLAKEAIDIGKVWIDAAAIILTGGSPNTSDLMEVARKAGESQTAGQELFRRMIAEWGDA